jgi:hypothetical protein
MRKDLGMRKGKMIAQGAHASLGALLTLFLVEDVVSSCGDKYHRYCIQFGDNCILSDWLNCKLLITFGRKPAWIIMSEHQYAQIYYN